MDYDDMEGLEYGGLGAWVDMQMVKDTLMASASGAGALLAGSYLIDMLQDKVAFLAPADPANKKRVKGALQVVLGLVAGRAVYDYSREASMGVVGGLGAVGMANIINTFLGDKAVAFEALSSGGMDNYAEDYEGMEALAALESANVSSAPGAFSALNDPTVSNEALMGLGAPLVQEETLGGYAAYLA